MTIEKKLKCIWNIDKTIKFNCSVNGNKYDFESAQPIPSIPESDKEDVCECIRKSMEQRIKRDPSNKDNPLFAANCLNTPCKEITQKDRDAMLAKMLAEKMKKLRTGR